MDIIPGEPLPPGFEDEVLKVPRIQNTLDQYKGNSLIGIEYTLELHESDRPEPGYLCLLCDKRGDPRTILNHWTSFNHRMKYLEKHYPTAVREFQAVKYKPNSHNYLILIVQSLAEAIEDFHGRLKIRSMDADNFRRQKTKWTEDVISAFHHDEKNGPNFLNAIDRSLLDQNVGGKRPDPVQIKSGPKRMVSTAPVAVPNTALRRDEFDAISSDSDNADSAKKPRMSSRPTSNKAAHEQDERKDETGKKLPTPKELSLQASHIAQEKYKWEKYRCMLEIHLKQVEKLQKEYEKSPEKHPQYPEEWKKFWNRRYKELQAEKKVDPNKHDYKPEWIIYWTKRMKDIFNGEVEKKKIEIKVKLGLPEEAEEKVDQLKERYKIPVNRIQRQQAPDVIDISDDEAPNGSRYSRRNRRSRTRSRSRSPRMNRGRGDYRRTRTRSRSRSRSLSPFSDDFDIKHGMQKSSRSANSRSSNYNPPETKKDYYPYGGSSRYPSIPSHSSSHYSSHQTAGHHYRVLDSSKIPKYEDSNSKDSKEDEAKGEDGPLTVVGVLRLLTALEEHLGSLGPKVVDLLGKALALEKVKANSSDDLLLNEDHCVFFETIKEKLKGLLIADVIDEQQKVRAVKKAVKNIAGIIHQVNSGPTKEDGNDGKSKDADNSSSIITTPQGQRKPNHKLSMKDLPFDRQMVATKMAAALVMQGREDVSTEDMDKLIYLFLLMVKLSKPKRELDGKPVYCKNILPELGIIPAINMSALPAALAALPGIVDGLLDKDLPSLMARDIDFENDVIEKEVPKNDTNSSTLESLTDSDLQTLLQNFKHLSSEEQHHLIAHLKKLESVDPERVEKLRKYVNTSDVAEPVASTSKASAVTDGSHSRNLHSSKNSNHDSPISASDKKREHAPGTDEDDRARASVNPNKFSLDDDDDDDYNFDEVFKAASKNISHRTPDDNSRHSADGKQFRSSNEPNVLSSQNDLTFNPAGLKTSSISDTQNLIANIMGSLQQSNSKNSMNKANSHPQPVPPVGQNEPPSGHHMSQQQKQPNMPFFQQQQHPPQQGHPDMQHGAYNQMAPNYYNAMGNYNQNPYAGYNQWGPGPNQQQIPGQQQQMPGQFGMPNYGMPNQGGYNMYGPSGN